MCWPVENPALMQASVGGWMLGKMLGGGYTRKAGTGGFRCCRDGAQRAAPLHLPSGWLLVFDGVADFGWGGAGEGGGGGVVVHFGDGGGADFVGDGFDDFAGGGIFYDADRAVDFEGVSDFEAGFFANVEDEGVAGDVGDEPVDFELYRGNFGGAGVELRAHVIDGFVSGFAEDGVAEVAATHIEGA